MNRGYLASCWWTLLAALELAGTGLAQETRLGTEFQVNSYTNNSQWFPTVAADADGDFVVVWYSNGQDGASYGVFARRFSSAGVALATEFQVNSYTTNYQGTPSVAADADRDFVVAWSSFSQDGPSNGVFARRFSSAGVALATEFQVNSYTSGNQASPSAAADTDGDFVVAWSSDGQDGAANGVFARRFSSAGVALATEFRVNSYTTGSQGSPSVAAEGNGDFVVAWNSNGQDGPSYGVFARRFTSAGTPLATEFQVNSYTTDTQASPSVAADNDGDFVIAWYSSGQDGASNGIFARRFSSTGAPLAAEFQINSYTGASQANASVAMKADGAFVVAWQSNGQDGSSYGVFARRFSSAGAPLATEFQANSYTANQQAFAAVAAAGGHFVVVWHSNLEDGPAYGVFAQRFAALAVLDIDGNGATAALSDGLLVLRHLFGFTGATLVTGAVDLVGCARCTAPAIEAYFAGLAVLDIDGNGSTAALTDGLLVLRYLFGFTGATLVTGAVDLAGCARCTAPAIEPYIAGLV